MSKNRTAQQNDSLRVFANEFDRTTLVERFERRPALNNNLDTFTASVTAAEMIAVNVANKDFEVLGTNMTTALATFSDGTGVTLTTAGAAADSAILLPHLSTNQSSWAASKWNTLDEVAFAAKIKTAASIACTIWAGLKLTNTPVVTTDADQCMFRYSNAHATYPTKLLAVYSVGNTDYELDTGIVVAVSTSYLLEIAIDSARVPRFFVNGELVATGTALTTNIDLIPYVGVLADSATAAKALTVRKLAIAKVQND